MKELDKFVSDRPEFRECSELHRFVLKFRERIDERPDKGTSFDFGDFRLLEELKDKALKDKKPATNLLDAETFNREFLLSVLEKILEAVRGKDVTIGKGAEKLLSSLKSGKVDFRKILDAILENDIASLKRQAADAGVDWVTVSLSFSILVQPFLEEVARRLGDRFMERWGRGQCPVCGRVPIVARIRKGGRVRYMVCSLCGAEYVIDLFYCPSCGNKDPHKLGFLSFEEAPEFSVDFCDVCKHYVKVLDENKLRTGVPRGLEDVITLPLDEIAERKGLKRV